LFKKIVGPYFFLFHFVWKYCYPVTDQISKSSLTRLVEGIRIHKELPGSKLVLSGGGGFDPMPNARIMAHMNYS
jgi:hypothetical protein